LIKISITGPESTGKSWLAEKLAGHFQTLWVPEYAREYLARLNRDYVFEDILEIAKGQWSQEKKMMETASGMLFCDTDLLVARIWSEFKYGRCDPWIIRQLDIHRYDLYLLCDIDLPWEADPLRENPHQRKELFDLYQMYLEQMNVNYCIISGNGMKRLEMAIEAVEKTLKVDMDRHG
jgi:NadR type nicotinamide-nucleotide adenylyltransferase